MWPAPVPRTPRPASRLLKAYRQNDCSEGEHKSGGNGEPVEVALDHCRSCGRRADAAAEHVREPAAAATVQKHEEHEGRTHHDMDEEDERRQHAWTWLLSESTGREM